MSCAEHNATGHEADIQRSDERAEGAAWRSVVAEMTADEIERSVKVLGELRDIGARMIAVMDRMVLGIASPEQQKVFAGVNLGTAFPAIAKAVRQCVALQQDIMGEREKRRSSQASIRKSQAKRVVDRAVTQAVAADKTRPERSEMEKRALRTRAENLFDDYDHLGELEHCTIGQLIGRICRTLGVKPDLSMWPDAAEPETAVATEVKPPGKPKRVVPSGLSGASTVGLMGKPPVVPAFAGTSGRGPP